MVISHLRSLHSFGTISTGIYGVAGYGWLDPETHRLQVDERHPQRDPNTEHRRQEAWELGFS